MLLQMVSNSLILLVILLYFTNLVEVSGYVSVSGSYSCNSVNDCSNEILACTKEASSCTINCQGQYYCQNTVVYSAATTTTINCDAFYGCNTMSIYCGDLSIANERHNLYFPNGLSESDFVRDTTSTDIISCDVNPIYSQSFMNGFFGCYGDIIDQCTMDSNTFWGIQSSTFECDTRFGSDSSNTDCIASCDLECSVTLDCYAKGNNVNYDQCECSGNYGTNNPTYCSINSNTIPTVLPTELPTDKPSVQPTNKPSVEPTDKPSNYPSDKPSNMPSVNPSDRPTNMPSIETTNNNDNNDNDNETAGPSGTTEMSMSTTSGVYPSTVVSDTSTMASNRPANVSSDDSNNNNNNGNDAVIGNDNGSNGNDSTLMIIAICLGITFLLVLVICGVGVAYMRKNKKENEKNGKNGNLPTNVTGIVGRHGSNLTFETNSDGNGDAALGGGAVVAGGGSGSGSVNIILPQNTDGTGNFSQLINSNSPTANDGEIGTFGFGNNSPQSDTNDNNNNLLNVGNGKGLPPAPETDESLLRNTDDIDHENQSDSDKMYDNNNNNNDDNNDNNENELELHNVEGMSIADGQTGAFFMGENDNNNDNNNNNNNNDDEAQYINDDDYANPGASPRSRGIGNSKRFTNQGKGKKNRKRTDGDIATPRGVVALPKLPQIV